MTPLLLTRRVKEALARVRQLFVATPNATLTAPVAAQMVGLDGQVCRALLQNLVETGFLEQRKGGLFARRRAASPRAGGPQ